MIHQGAHPFGFRFPIALHLVVHAQGGGLVDRDRDCLAHETPTEEVTDDVAGDRLEAVVPGDDVVLPAQFPFEFLLLLTVEICRLDHSINIVVEIGIDQLQFGRSVLIEQRHGGAVLHGLLEVVDRDILTEHLTGSFLAID